MSLNKAERVLAYKIVDEILSRPVPAVVLKHQIPDGMDVDEPLILNRVFHILENLRSDAKDLWDES